MRLACPRLSFGLILLVASFALGRAQDGSPATERAPEPASKDPAPSADLASSPGRRVGLPNGDFEAAESHWVLTAARGLARVAPEAAHRGGAGLRIESPVDDQGASVTSARLPAEGAGVYRLTWQARVLAGTGTTLFLRFFDAKGTELQREMGRVTTDRGDRWTPGVIHVIAPPEARELDLLIRRIGARSPRYTVDFDDFDLTVRPLRVAAPWPGTYKLRPDETARLTAADVVGPDGRVYPDWTWAGVPGGIPHRPVVVRLADLGAAPETDISVLLEEAAARAAERGGGAVEIGEGTFYLDEPVLIHSDQVVLRGQGAERTRLLFRYHIPRGELRFFRVRDGDRLGLGATIEFHVNPFNLVELELRSGAQRLTSRARRDHWGNTFSLRLGVDRALEALGEGRHPFTGVARYEDGTSLEQTIHLELTRSEPGRPMPAQLGAINFAGSGGSSPRWLLTADAARGDRRLRLAPGHGLRPGDRVSVVAPASERWRELVGHASPWGDQAQNFHEVVAVDEGGITLHQPMRAPFPVADGSYVQKVTLLFGSGLEDVYLEQVEVPGQGPPGPKHPHTLWHPIEDVWTNGVTFSYAWACWMTGVTVRHAGRHPAYFLFTKHLEVRDCLFDDVLFKGGGGTGYVGFERSWDGWMEKVEARGLRHGPNVQWSAAGNVIRNGRFLGSDGQWHAGWTLENLYENNFIDARGDGGSYGHGLYASGPSIAIHGPQGPRNVAYNNDVVGRRDALHMLGGNEGWMILHNRFTTGDGRAVFAKEKSFDHIIEGNVFVLRQAQAPAVLLGADSVGVELVNNTFYGVVPPFIGFVGGRTQLARDEGNRWVEEVPRPAPERPKPSVPSIFQWQQENRAEIRAAQARRDGDPAAP